MHATGMLSCCPYFANVGKAHQNYFEFKNWYHVSTRNLCLILFFQKPWIQILFEKMLITKQLFCMAAFSPRKKTAIEVWECIEYLRVKILRSFRKWNVLMDVLRDNKVKRNKPLVLQCQVLSSLMLSATPEGFLIVLLYGSDTWSVTAVTKAPIATSEDHLGFGRLRFVCYPKRTVWFSFS